MFMILRTFNYNDKKSLFYLNFLIKFFFFDYFLENFSENLKVIYLVLFIIINYLYIEYNVN